MENSTDRGRGFTVLMDLSSSLHQEPLCDTVPVVRELGCAKVISHYRAALIVSSWL